MVTTGAPAPPPPPDYGDPFLGTNLPMYAAFPASRRLSAFDPEWEDDPAAVEAARRDAQRALAGAKKLPSPDVLRDVIRELHQQRARIAAPRAPEPVARRGEPTLPAGGGGGQSSSRTSALSASVQDLPLDPPGGGHASLRGVGREASGGSLVAPSAGSALRQVVQAELGGRRGGRRQPPPRQQRPIGNAPEG
eukprot:SAG25_NODE_3885_length_938_cov_0.927294_1_plen_192_part_01